jgi:Uma2 family endonuclease
MADSVSPEYLNSKKHFTYAEYKNWNPGKDGRYELIYGVAYPMFAPNAMAAPGANHQAILMELSRQIANFLVGKPCKVLPAPFDVRLFYAEDESDSTVVQPDISIICDERKLGAEGCRGAPDFVAEILSPSNMAPEMERKFELYRQAGVREYWVLDPEHKILHTHHFEGPQILTRFYGPADTVPVEILPGLHITMESVFL